MVAETFFQERKISSRFPLSSLFHARGDPSSRGFSARSGEGASLKADVYGTPYAQEEHLLSDDNLSLQSEASSDEGEADSDSGLDLEVPASATSSLRRSVVPKLSSMPPLLPPMSIGGVVPAPYTPVPALRRQRLGISPPSVTQASGDVRRLAQGECSNDVVLSKKGRGGMNVTQAWGG